MAPYDWHIGFSLKADHTSHCLHSSNFCHYNFKSTLYINKLKRMHFPSYWFINWPYNRTLHMRIRTESLDHQSEKADLHTSSLSLFYKPVLGHQTWEGAHVIDTSVDRSAPRLWDIDWMPETYIITACFRSFLCKFRRYRL